MGAAITPVLDQWYSSPCKAQAFLVVALGNDYAQIQYLDGYHGIVWLDDWEMLDAELIPPPPSVHGRPAAA